ncbi:MAG: glycosyltransferase family 1 protein [Pseudomonadota bacterium]
MGDPNDLDNLFHSIFGSPPHGGHIPDINKRRVAHGSAARFLTTRPMRKNTLAILTNARAADQRSMIGYGEMVLEAARQTEYKVIELRASSLLGGLLPERVTGIPRKLANNIDRFVFTPLILAFRRADVVHVVDPGNIVYLPLIRHRRSIVTVHDMIPYLARDGKLPGWRPTRTGRWLMERILMQLAKVDQIICVSQATKRDLLAYVNIPEDRVSIILNAVFQPMQPAMPEACSALRARLGLPSEAPLILHVGRNFYKNREVVLEVAATVRCKRPEVHLVTVGSLTPTLEVKAEALELTGVLHVLPQVDRADMAALYTTAAVLLFPSLYEGFGLPVLEAQMCGTPVVCSDRGSLPEVADRETYVVDIEEPSNLTAVVLRSLALCSNGCSTEMYHDNDRFSASSWRFSMFKFYRFNFARVV